MRVYRMDQGSGDWLTARVGIPTASEFHNLVTPLGKVKTGGAVDTYLYQKLGEKWVGSPLMSFAGGVLEQGKLLEEEVLPWYELVYDKTIDRVGFVTTDDGRAGASPDGLVGGSSGLELKAPQPPAHCRYLIEGGVPDDYIMQVQGCLYVTGFKTWEFLSYCRGFPAHRVVVSRDEKIMTALAEALKSFNARFDECWKRLIEMNGGVLPERPRAIVREEPRGDGLPDIVKELSPEDMAKFMEDAEMPMTPEQLKGVFA